MSFCIKPIAHRILLVTMMLCCASLTANAAVHTAGWDGAPAQSSEDSDSFRPGLRPLEASCDATDSCADAPSYLYPAGYLRDLSPDSAAPPQVHKDWAPSSDSAAPKGWLTSLLEGFGGILEPGEAAIAALGILTFGISALTMQGRNPPPRKRKYRAHR